jgi:transcriptional regulator with XRE-family HTH domain
MDIADQVRRARQAAGLSQRELAERAGMPQSTVARVEGRRIDPRWSTAARLLRAAGHESVLLPRPGEGVDRSLIREMLKLTPLERIEATAAEASFLDMIENARRIS